jgi:hypothetical protein
MVNWPKISIPNGTETIKDIVLFPAAVIVKKLASRDILFTEVIEGTAKAIMKGGEFYAFIIAWQNKTIAVKKSKTKDGKTIEIGDVIDANNSMYLFGGIRYIGIPPIKNIYVYNFKWRGVDIYGNPQEERGGKIDYILLKRDVYYIEVKAAETGGEEEWVPVDVGCLVTIRVTNPYKALFGAQNWLTAITTLVVPQVGDFISEESYGSLTSERKKFEEKIVAHLWKNPYTPIPTTDSADLGSTQKPDQNAATTEPENNLPFVEYIEETYGALIEDFKIGQVSISTDVPKDSLAAKSLEKFIKRMEGKGKVETAEYDAKVVLIGAKAESKRIKKVVRAWEGSGKLGPLVRSWEAMEKSNAAFSFGYHEIPGLKELLGDLGYRGGQNKITKEDLANLGEILKEFQTKKD